jgi:hypothetical protein
MNFGQHGSDYLIINFTNNEVGLCNGWDSLLSPGYKRLPVNVRFLAKEEALGEGFLRIFRFPPVKY